MIMQRMAIFISSVLVLGACSSEPKVIHLRTEKVNTKKVNTVAANHILTMEVKGMTCEMGCGGSIRKELKASGGVARVEFVNFDENKKVQTAKVSFDNTKITADQMVKIITTMNEKQFKVGKTSSEIIETTSSTVSETPSDSKEETVEISESNFVLPNLIDILVGIVQ